MLHFITDCFGLDSLEILYSLVFGEDRVPRVRADFTLHFVSNVRHHFPIELWDGHEHPYQPLVLASIEEVLGLQLPDSGNRDFPFPLHFSCSLH